MCFIVYDVIKNTLCIPCASHTSRAAFYHPELLLLPIWCAHPFCRTPLLPHPSHTSLAAFYHPEHVLLPIGSAPLVLPHPSASHTTPTPLCFPHLSCCLLPSWTPLAATRVPRPHVSHLLLPFTRPSTPISDIEMTHSWPQGAPHDELQLDLDLMMSFNLTLEIELNLSARARYTLMGLVSAFMMSCSFLFLFIFPLFLVSWPHKMAYSTGIYYSCVPVFHAYRYWYSPSLKLRKYQHGTGDKLPLTVRTYRYRMVC